MLSKTEADAAYIYELETQNAKLREARLTPTELTAILTAMAADEREAAILEAARKVADASAKYHGAFTSPVEIEEEIERLGRLWEVAIREYRALTEGKRKA